MPLSMYDASAPVFVRLLNNLNAILDKAVAHAQAQGIDPAQLVNASLAPDMFALSRQIQIATDAAKGCVARLAQADVPSFADTESNFAELKARIDKTIAFIQNIAAEQLEGSETRIVTIKAGEREFSFPGQAYLLFFAMPNFYFHMTTTYNILRHNGVALGKMDFLGGV